MADGDKYSFWNLPGESEKIYRFLGVNYFYRILPTFGFLVSRAIRRRDNWKLYWLRGSIEDRSLSKQIYFTKLYEVIHLALIPVIFSINFITGLNLESLFFYVPLQILGNVYPVLTQRWMRQRLYRVQKRIDGLESRVSRGKMLVSSWEHHLKGVKVLDTTVKDDQNLTNLSTMCYAATRSPEVQKKVRKLDNLFNGDPVVGHLKGIVKKSQL